MREILFKAKRINNGKWVEGYYCKWLKGERIITYSEKETDCIITWMSNGGMSRYEVDLETLCQFTGLCDKNGKKIWENDILKYEWGEEKIDVVEYQPPIFTYSKSMRWSLNQDEVIGNIFDNPELLQEVK